MLPNGVVEPPSLLDRSGCSFDGTEELRDFVADDEQKPKRMLYPRDPSLDPQLVWKGKDEQDASPLDVPVVPI